MELDNKIEISDFQLAYQFLKPNFVGIAQNSKNEKNTTFFINIHYFHINFHASYDYL